MDSESGDLGFSFEETTGGCVQILRDGKVVTILRSQEAVKFLEKVRALNAKGCQQHMARVTGNYKRGNERMAKKHERNR